jgi:hypothetical protein
LINGDEDDQLRPLSRFEESSEENEKDENESSCALHEVQFRWNDDGKCGSSEPVFVPK